MEITIYRFDPDKDKKPYLQTYTVKREEVSGQMLLNALETIRMTQDDSLSFRRSCGEGVCGSDGMNINGKNGLACITRLSSLPKKITLRPLPGLPVIRDLIVDMSAFIDQYKKAKPYLQPGEALPATEIRQTPEQRAELDGLYECILCACCSTACPSFWWNPEKFLGPAALLWVCRFLTDSRDSAKSERLQALKDAFSVFRCRGIMNCVSVCPKNLNPTKAINRIKTEMLKDDA